MTDAVAVRDGTTGQISLGPATRKLSPGEAGFRRGGGIPGLSCGDCRYFVQDKCFIVDVDQVNPADYCDEFNPALQGGNIPSPSGETLTALSRPAAMYITRVATDQRTGQRRWYATSSGTKIDAYGERMSVDLYRDFIKRIESGEPVPEVFASNAWKGGNPYLGVAHYLDLDGYGIVGDGEKVYIDGSILKAMGTFRETAMAAAAYRSIDEDIRTDRPPSDRVRISIAFIDWGHDHIGHGTFKRRSLTDHCEMCEAGIGGKVYRKGHLVHLALTRRPAYPETEIVLEERSMETKRTDAASIVGEENAEELEKKAKPLTLRGAMVVKAEDEYAASGTMQQESYLGGAVTLAEAEAFLGKSTPPLLLNEWGVLVGVLANISASPRIENKAVAIRAVIADFQSTVDVQTAQVLSKIAPLLARGGDTGMEQSTVEAPAPTEPAPEPTPEAPPAEPVVRAEAPAPAPAATLAAPAPAAAVPAAAPAPAAAPGAHPLEEVLMAFRSAFDAAMGSPVTPDERLVMLQPALDNLADVVIRLIAGAPAAAPAPATAAAPAAASAPGQMMAAASLNAEDFDARIDQRIAQHVAPLTAAVVDMQKTMQAIAARMAPAPARQPAPRVPAPVERPVPRALRLVPRTLTPLAPGLSPQIGGPAKKVSHLRQYVRRSVGIPD